MALGSTHEGIVRLILKEGFALVGLGLLLGFVGAIGLRGVIATQIYGIRVLSPEIILSVAALLGAVALVACVLPARRAMQVEPAIVLNDQ